MTRRALLAGSASALAGPLLLRAAEPAAAPASPPPTQPVRKPGGRRDVPPRMSIIRNEQVKLGVDLALGGAITHLSPADRPERNLVNSYDLGRQVQMSYFSGPVPYRVEGHAGPPDNWRHIGWNPIQVGDDYGNPSRVIEHRNDGRELYVKCVPMQWPLDGVPGECVFECWAGLEGAAVRVRCRLTMERADRTQWPARSQEMPAVYTNGPWYRLFTYDGERPFGWEAVRRIIKEPPNASRRGERPRFPWSHWTATENWAALVDEDDWGLGVWNPRCARFIGGFAGRPGRGGPKDSPTGYISPIRREILDHNLVHEYGYALVLGKLQDIREWVYAQPHRPGAPVWAFERDRQGWTYRNATDAGWPILGELDVDLSGHGPQLLSPPATWQAADAPRVVMEAAFTGGVKRVEIRWATAAEPDFSRDREVTVPVTGDGQMRAYGADLGGEMYHGLITQLRIDPQPAGLPGGRVRLKAVLLRKA